MLWLAAISAAVMAVVAVILALGVQPLDADPAAPSTYGDSFWTTLGWR